LLDLRSDEGREAMSRLLDTADVFITNFRLDAWSASTSTTPPSGPSTPA